MTQSMHTWHWRTWEGLPYLTCSLLQKWPHGFFTQQFWPLYPAEFIPALRPDVKVYRAKQVHGNTVVTPKEIEQFVGAETEIGKLDKDFLPPADGIVTEQADRAVWICTADCTPVLIGDVETGQVAAIHAGWRGTAQKIVPVAIARLQSAGSQLKNLRIAMGPAIAGEVYQVDVQVAAQVGASIIPSDSPQEILDTLQWLPNPPILPDQEDGKVRLDVRRVNELQLERMGISGEQVAIAPHCTYQQPEHFFSYRRDKEKKVQWSGIVSS